LRFVVDENVSYELVSVLREAGSEVIAIAETSTTGLHDEGVFNIAEESGSVLITRDYHFTNPIRFPAERTGGIFYIRRGNLTSEEEIRLVQNFLSRYSKDAYSGKLVTLYKNRVQIR